MQASDLRRKVCTCALAAAALWIAGPAAAHDVEHRILPGQRVELSFGRSQDHDYTPPEPGTYRLPPIKPAADGLALDTKGRVVSLHRLMDGRITVLAFIYTRCADPQGCPLSIGLLYELLDVSERDPAIGRNMRLIAMSFDIEHDTPAVMEKFGAGAPADGQGAELLFLTAESDNALASILEAYGQPIGRKSVADDPFGPFTHLLRVYLIDREARIRNIYSLGFLDPRLVITDIRTLLLEESGRGTAD